MLRFTFIRSVFKTFFSAPSARFLTLGRVINVCVFLAIMTLASTTLFAFDYFRSPGPLPEQRNILIPNGASLKKIAWLLEENAVLQHPELFTLIVRLTESGTSLQAGEYAFSPHISPFEVFHKITSGDTVLHMLTVPEGLMTSQVLELIQNTPYLEGEVPQNVQEGELLPETYGYHLGDTRAALVERMRQDMRRTLEQLWEKRADDLPVKTIEEALTLASIVEKETGIADERGRVAAVFINRLRKRMRLQSDPTTIYAITNGESVLERKLLSRDLALKSPYNTYAVYGLPPGPIANPGKNAIEAVLNPPATNELYFVADGTGGHQFASSLEEHNRNVQRWRQISRSKK